MNTPIRNDEIGAVHRPFDSKPTVIAFAIAILAWATDYKSQGAGSAAAYQAILLITYVGMLVLVSITAIKAELGIGTVWVLLLAVAVFMADSAILAWSYHRDSYAILVNLIPPFVYASAAALTYVTLSIASDRLQLILNLLRVACLAYAAGHLGAVFLTKGIDVAHSRYEVFSGAVTPSLAIVAIMLIRRVSRMDLLIMVFNLAITLLSVTRTLFVVLAAQVASLFIVRPSSLIKGKTLKGFALVAIIGVAIGAVDLATGAGLVERWVDRLTVGVRLGADPTALTRSAETHFMMANFRMSTETLMFGNGLAARIYMTGPDAARAAQMVGWQSVTIYDIGYGHQNYANILFIAGLFGGGGLLIMQILNGMQALVVIRHVQICDASGVSPEAHLAIWGALIVLGALTYGLLGSVIGDRSTCVWYGIGTGILYWYRERIHASAVVPAAISAIPVSSG
jgi:hypothetical protein